MVLYVLSYLSFEIPSMSQNTSNLTPPTENPGVYTGGAASIGNANFTGGGHAFGSNNTVHNYHQGPDANELKKHQLITTLPRAEAGRKVHEHEKQSGPCFPGTRQAVLQKMKEWATNPNELGMYVLSGLAGIGKSTVAYTIAAWADERHHLGAEFFFSRDEADRRCAKFFFTTIAYDLYYFNEDFERAIGEALVTKDRSTGSPQEQLDALILHPLKPIRNAFPPTLIVVDALDECDGEDACFVLKGLQQLVQALPSFKVILTTRPEALSNNDSTTQEGRKVFRMYDIEADVVNEDIRIYLKYYLSTEQVKARLPHLKKQWCASDAQVELLVKASGKLFIMTSTAVRYILDTFWSAPDRQIKTLLDAFAQGRTPFDELVGFYTVILRSAVPANLRDTALVERYQAIVGTIVLAQVPLSVHSIARLIDIDIDEIFVVLGQLQSVISVTDDIPHVYHKSFVDYITDSEQCEDINLRIDPTKRHTRIARRCFEMMGKDLKFNILELGIPARFMSNEEGLAQDGITDEKLQEKIPLVLQYACVYWDGHLKCANVDDADLMNELEKFDNARALLPWFEVLSLIRKLDSAQRAIRVALKVMKPTPSDLPDLLSDGLRFISKFYEIIERSALQTYYSALLFTPSDSLLYRRYIDKAVHGGCNVIGKPNQWDPLIANLRHGPNLCKVQFSLDGTMCVSWNSQFGSPTAMLKVWDAITGTPISKIEGGSSFAIADDFSTIASFENNAITLYNIDGSEQGTTLTTSTTVIEVAISSKSLSRIAAGLYDGTVSLWDTKDGKHIGSFGDYQCCSRLEFSATARLAYLADKKYVVKLWDGIKQELVADLEWDTPDVILRAGSREFAFSRDGSRIVSWRKSGVKLWDCGDGRPIWTMNRSSVFTVAITDNGSLLAISCGDNVEVWENRGNCLSRIADLDLRPNVVWLVAFLPDDTLAIVARFDIMLYNIKNRSLLYILSADCCSLAFSPDCTHFAVGSDPDGIVTLLDIRVYVSSGPSSNRQGLTALNLSWNCSRVACGFEDGAVELWETDGFSKRRIAAHEHHQRSVMTLGFSPDGKQFASGSDDGTINLWDGEDGARHADLRYFPEGFCVQLRGVEVSNSVVAAVGNRGISLWDCKTLDCIQSFDGDFTTPVSFSADGALLAAVAVQYQCSSITFIVFDVTTHTAIATFDTGWSVVHTMSFLPDNSRLIASGNLYDSKFEFLTFTLISKKAIRGPSFENFIQLPSMPLWHGVPVWVNKERGQYYLEALFSQHDNPVPVLWIPWEFVAQKWVQRRSMIVIGCHDGRVILLRLPTTTTGRSGTVARAGYDRNLSYDRQAQQTAVNTHVPTALIGKDFQEAGGFTS
ncbi:hypothetical protein M378DRAFT_17576 [Amanita muscaria Koide BX008]|uniref:NACHT domain-containing protein n=1 Tax=Amanita muscaria (strain Koide BX008) TaxID=946122 RepID=A0A0C2RZN8_AMAMK|nr:hypothetical protein M378DRAFT_17576 [Amanita muscaria Koide BX008]